MQLEIAQRTHKGLVRAMNQDAILVLPEAGIFLVADGMGGEQAGEEASEQVVKTVRAATEAFFATPPGGPSQVEGMLRDTLAEANHDVFQISVVSPEKRGLGSTGSLLCLHRGVYFIAQVGDSRVYLRRGDDVRQLTHDQTLVWLLYEQGAITRDQLETHPERHLLTQCIGSARPINSESVEGAIEPGDVFLICSDGLTGYAGEEAVQRILLGDQRMEKMADTLVNEALKGGGGDNVSVILVRVTGLDPQDTWRPEATAPPPDFSSHLNDRDFITGETPPMPPPPKGRRCARWIAAGVILLLTLAGIGALALWPRGIIVHLADLPTGNLKIWAQNPVTAGETDLHKTADGYEYRLPGAGHYKLRLFVDGYAPVWRELEVAAGQRKVDLKTGPWVREARLAFELPGDAAITRLRVVREAPGEAPRDAYDFPGGSLVRDMTHIPGVALTGDKQLGVAIEPDIKHTVIAEADGKSPFTARVQMRPGDTRTLKIFFNHE